MFALGAAVIVRHFLPSAIQSRRPEEIGTRLFLGKLAGVFSNGWIDKAVVNYALNGELYRTRDVRLWGGTYQYCHGGLFTDFVNQCLGAQFVFA